MSIEINVRQETVVARIRRLRRAMPGIVQDERKQIADEIAKEMRELVSVPNVSAPGQPPGRRTGRLMSSITVASSVNADSVGPTVDYGVYLERGTSRMAARPFIDASSQGPIDAFAERIWNRIEEIL